MAGQASLPTDGVFVLLRNQNFFAKDAVEVEGPPCSACAEAATEIGGIAAEVRVSIGGRPTPIGLVSRAGC